MFHLIYLIFAYNSLGAYSLIAVMAFFYSTQSSQCHLQTIPERSGVSGLLIWMTIQTYMYFE
jgi:amino acid permease